MVSQSSNTFFFVMDEKLKDRNSKLTSFVPETWTKAMSLTPESDPVIGERENLLWSFFPQRRRGLNIELNSWMIPAEQVMNQKKHFFFTWNQAWVTDSGHESPNRYFHQHFHTHVTPIWELEVTSVSQEKNVDWPKLPDPPPLIRVEEPNRLGDSYYYNRI